jgi:hypothetical protein
MQKYGASTREMERGSINKIVEKIKIDMLLSSLIDLNVSLR